MRMGMDMRVKAIRPIVAEPEGDSLEGGGELLASIAISEPEVSEPEVRMAALVDLPQPDEQMAAEVAVIAGVRRVWYVRAILWVWAQLRKIGRRR